MKKLPLLIAILSLVLSCTTNLGTNDETISGVKAMIYEPDGKTPAAGATVKIFKVSATDGQFVSKQTTGADGRYSITQIPDGEYNVWAEKDSNVTFQDSVVISKTQTTLHSDTLECPSTLTGIVGVQPQDDPRTVTIQVVGTDKYFNNTDENGRFTMTGMAGGPYSLLFKSTQLDYTPTTHTITVQRCSEDTLKDTIKLIYTGIPVVLGLRISQDTLAGAVSLFWDKTTYKNIQDYVIYRDSCTALNLSIKHFAMTSDTLVRDTVFRSSIVLPDDTIPLCLKYRVAVRNNVQEIGPTYRYTSITIAPKSFITTFFNHQVRHAELGCDSASINDTVIVSVNARNRTRPLRTITWYDPKKEETIATSSSADSLAREISDTIRYPFDSVGINRLFAIFTDDAGKKWTDTIPIKIVRDAPKANAGNDTAVLVNDTIRLRGNAMQRFGIIETWKWKIGSGDWLTTSGPDTIIIAPKTEQTVLCSLVVTDDDGNRSVDEKKIYVSEKVKDVAAGCAHSLILKTDGTLWACGWNGDGQLGDGTKTERITPVQVMSDVQNMATGGYLSLILKTDGTLWACGDNEYGQLGDGTTISQPTPIQVMSDVKSIDGCLWHSLILKTNGTLWACGLNNCGQLGDGTTISQSTPMQVMSDVQSIAGNGLRSLILKTDGTLWACGSNQFGQLGDGTTTNRYTPIQVMSDVQSIADGAYHSLILKTDGTVWACGSNQFGELGDGTTTNRLTPVRIIPPQQ